MWDASGQARDASVQGQNLVIKLQQDLCNCHTLFARCRVHSEHVRDVTRMHAGCVWDTCERYLGAELYRIRYNNIQYEKFRWNEGHRTIIAIESALRKGTHRRAN